MLSYYFNLLVDVCVCEKSLSNLGLCKCSKHLGEDHIHMARYLSVPLLTQRRGIGLVLRGVCLADLISHTEATKNFWMRIRCFQYGCILLTWQLFCNGLQMLCCLSASLWWPWWVKVAHLTAVLQLHMLLVWFFYCKVKLVFLVSVFIFILSNSSYQSVT